MSFVQTIAERAASKKASQKAQAMAQYKKMIEDGTASKDVDHTLELCRILELEPNEVDADLNAAAQWKTLLSQIIPAKTIAELREAADTALAAHRAAQIALDAARDALTKAASELSASQNRQRRLRSEFEALILADFRHLLPSRVPACPVA
jgi:hypothetical protein